MPPLPYHPSLPAKPVGAPTASPSTAPFSRPPGTPHRVASPASPFMPPRSTGTPTGYRATSTSAGPFDQPSPASPRPTAGSHRAAAATSQAAKAIPARLSIDDATTNDHLLRLGAGWKIYFRAWSAPPLFGSDSSTKKAAETAPPAKKAKTSGDSTPNSSATSAIDTPNASTSKAAWSERLDEVKSVDIERDPIEAALQQIRSRSEGVHELERMFGFFSHVQLRPSVPPSAKGKEKESSTEELQRVLWLFRIESGTGDLQEPPRIKARQLLGSIHFEGLTTVHQGAFTHADLFPSMYNSNKYQAPISKRAVAVPDALALADGFSAKFSTYAPGQGPLAVLDLALRHELLRHLSQSQSYTLLDRKVLAGPFNGEDDGRTSAALLSMSIKLTHIGLRIGVKARDTTLAPLSNTALPPTDSPVRLSPSDCPAKFVRQVVPPQEQHEDFIVWAEQERRLRETWSNVLSLHGARLLKDEKWCLVRLTVPGEASHGTECLWPMSLVVVDTSRVKMPSPSPPRRTLSLVQKSTLAERRRQARAKVLPIPTRIFTDGLKASLERCTHISDRLALDEADRKSKEREEKENLHADAVTNGDVKSNPSHLGPAPVYSTPLSLGTGSTEAPSPADNLVQSERNLLNFIAGLTSGESNNAARTETAEELYPSPPQDRPRIHNEPGQSTADDEPFDFTWDDPFASSAHQPTAQQNDFDDGGLMLGLTDDDFSFFDTPVVPSTELQTSTFSTASLLTSSMPVSHMPLVPASTSASPSFIEHFAHLASTPALGHAASPAASSFAATHSPHLDSTPMESHSLSTNNLGLLASHPSREIATGSPYKTPRTPFTPFIEIADESETATPSLALSLPPPTPSAAPQSQHLHTSRFDSIRFGNSHQAADRKYTSPSGKFGLPSPEDEGVLHTSTKSQPLFSSLCDPRYASARTLKRKLSATQRSSRSRLAISRRHWKRLVLGDEGVSSTDDSSEDEYSDDDMGLDDESHGQSRDRLDDRRNSSKDLTCQSGAPYLLLGSFLPKILSGRMPKPKEVPKALSLTSPVALVGTPAAKAGANEPAIEPAAQLYFDQACHNPAFRARLADLRANKIESIPALRQVTSNALLRAHSAMEMLCKQFETASTSAPSVSADDQGQFRALKMPSISMRVQKTVMELDSSVARFWRPMAFEPLSGQKDVSAFVVFEDLGSELADAVKRWFKRVGEVYQSHRLGKHTPASHMNGICSLPVDSFSPTGPKEPLRKLTIQIAETARSAKHTVIYLLVNDGSIISTASSAHAFVMQQLQKATPGVLSFLLYPVPISALQENVDNALGETGTVRTEQIAFAVYDQLLVSVPKLRFPHPETFPSAPSIASMSGPSTRLFQAPSFTLSPHRLTPVQFEYAWPSHNLEILHRHRFLHVAYRVVRDPPFLSNSSLGAVEDQQPVRNEWLFVAVIDEKGEMWKVFNKVFRGTQAMSEAELAKNIVKTVWGYSRMVASTVDVEWRLAICKAERMSRDEVVAWQGLLKEQVWPARKGFHVSVLCTDDLDEQSAVSIVPKTNANAITERRDIRAAQDTPNHVDTAADWFAYTPSDPVVLEAMPPSRRDGHFDDADDYSLDDNENEIPTTDLIACASTYIAHVPRIASMTHQLNIPSFLSTVSQSAPRRSASPISVLGVHVMISTAAKTSTYEGTLKDYLDELGQSYAELAVLGQTRWATSGRLPWHIEAVSLTAEIAQHQQ